MTEEEIPLRTVEDFLRTTSFQDYVLEHDLNPFDYTCRLVQGFHANGEVLQKVLDGAKRKLYTNALAMGAVAVVGYDHSIAYGQSDHRRTRVASVAGTAVIPKTKEEREGSNDE